MTRLWAVIGQSNGRRMFEVGTATTTSPVRQSSNGTTWTQPTFSGTVNLLDGLYAGFNEPCDVLGSCVGGTGLVVENNTTLGIPYWLDLSTNSIYNQFLAKAAATGRSFDGVIWMQGEADAHSAYADIQDVYMAGLTTLFDRLQRDVSFAGTPRFVVYGTGRSTQGYGTDASWHAVREAQRIWSGSTSGGVWAGEAIDHALADGVHWTSQGYADAGKRIARAILSARGLASSARGPLVSSWSQSGTSIDVTVSHNGTTIVPASGGVTGFTAVDANGSAIPVSSAARLSSTVVRLTLASDTIASAVRYLYGAAPDITGIVRDDTSLAVPMESYAPPRLILGPSPAIQASGANVTWAAASGVRTYTQAHITSPGGTVKLAGTDADRFDVSLTTSPGSSEIIVPQGAMTAYLGVTPQAGDGPLSARLDVPT